MSEQYATNEDCPSCGMWLDLYIDPDLPRKAWKECHGCGMIPEAFVIEVPGERQMDSRTALQHCMACGVEPGQRHRPRCPGRHELLKATGVWAQRESAHGRDDATQTSSGGPNPSEQTATQERDDMKDQNDNPKNSTVKMVGDAVAHGGKVAVASEAGDVLLEIAQAALGDRYPDLFKNDEGKQIAKMTVAIMLHYGTDSHPGAFPGPEAIGKACEYVVEGSARDLIQPRLTALRPKLDKLASVGQRLKQIEAKESAEAKPNGASTHIPAGQVSTDD